MLGAGTALTAAGLLIPHRKIWQVPRGAPVGTRFDIDAALANANRLHADFARKLYGPDEIFGSDLIQWMVPPSGMTLNTVTRLRDHA
jgi:hypothetical protein